MKAPTFIVKKLRKVRIFGHWYKSLLKTFFAYFYFGKIGPRILIDRLVGRGAILEQNDGMVFENLLVNPPIFRKFPDKFAPIFIEKSRVSYFLVIFRVPGSAVPS